MIKTFWIHLHTYRTEYLEHKEVISIGASENKFRSFVRVAQKLHHTICKPLEDAGPKRSPSDDNSKPELQGHAPVHRMPVDLWREASYRGQADIREWSRFY